LDIRLRGPPSCSGHSGEKRKDLLYPKSSNGRPTRSLFTILPELLRTEYYLGDWKETTEWKQQVTWLRIQQVLHSFGPKTWGEEKSMWHEKLHFTFVKHGRVWVSLNWKLTQNSVHCRNFIKRMIPQKQATSWQADKKLFTESNYPASYSGGSGLNSRPRNQAIRQLVRGFA
jgi:hypothetical protein